MNLMEYKELELNEETFMNYSGKDVRIRKIGDKKDLDGTLDFDPKDPEVFYLIQGSITRRFRVSSIDKLLVPSDC
jgi:hypothetical protein